MSSNATLLLARRSIRARIGRLIAISIAIILGVAFVVGSFVLADSMRSGFDSLFTAAFEKTDLQVRTALAFGDGSDMSTRDPVDASLLDTVAEVPGVAHASGDYQRNAQIIGLDGDAVSTGGAPMFGASWDGTDAESIELRDGRAPSGPNEVAVDKAIAEKEDFEIGDEISVITATGRHTFTLVGTVGLAGTDGMGGATFALWDTETAASLLGAEGVYDYIDVQVADGDDIDAVQNSIADVLPDNTEVVTRQTLIDESNDDVGEFIGFFGSGLLVFAFITAFVSAFLINNVFQITIGQRLRELALLRAVGGAGSQVRRLIVVEAFVMSVIATAIGIFAGIGVGKLILSIFNAAGAGFPDFGVKLGPVAIVMAIIVGVGITLLAVLIPAFKASRIPPVAAMRPELGFEALGTKRLVAGTVTTIVGTVMFLIGLLLRPGGTVGLIALAGIGALLLFLGTASVSSTVAKPMTKLIGWPVAKIYKAPGQLASENAGRAPRRTSATVAALMIGVSLVSASAVFASSLRNTFKEAYDRGVTADWVITGSGGFSLLPQVVETTLQDVPELDAVTGVTAVNLQIDGDSKTFGVADPVALERLINVGLEDGSWEGLQNGGIFVHESPAKDNDLTVGSTVEVTFENGVTRDLEVAGIYSDDYLVGGWLIGSNVVNEVLTGELQFWMIAVAADDGLSDAEAQSTIENALVDYPQADVKTAEEFKDAQAAQIDQLLVIITVLLAFAIIIAVLGISITLGLAVFERTREIGLMRAVGMTKRQTRKMVRWEAIIVSTFGALVGIVLGTAIGVVLSMAVSDSIIDGISFSPATIIAILIGAVVAGFVAALYPSLKASRMNVLEAIATE